MNSPYPHIEHLVVVFPHHEQLVTHPIMSASFITSCTLPTLSTLLSYYPMAIIWFCTYTNGVGKNTSDPIHPIEGNCGLMVKAMPVFLSLVYY